MRVLIVGAGARGPQPLPLPPAVWSAAPYGFDPTAVITAFGESGVPHLLRPFCGYWQVEAVILARTMAPELATLVTDSLPGLPLVDWNGEWAARVDAGANEPVSLPNPATLLTAALALGHQEEQAGRLAAALSYFQEALAYSPEEPAALAGLARSGAQCGESVENVLREWERAERASVRTGFLDRAQHPQPLPGLGRSLRTDPAADAAFQRFLLLEQLGRYDEAVAAVSPALYAVGDRLIETAATWLERGFAQPAHRLIHVLLDDSPTEAVLYHLLGVALVRIGERSAAIAAWRQALSLRPGWAMVQHNLAQLDAAR